MEDAEIVSLYWDRNQDAINESSAKYGRYCYQISYHILHSDPDAEECVNDTWLRAWDSMPPQSPSCLKAFLGKLARNLSLDRWDWLHAQKRGGGCTDLLLSELEECIPHPDNVEHAAAARELAAVISAWLRAQPQKNRVAFVRRYWYADSLASVAKRLGKSEMAVKSLLHRMRESLRLTLEQEGMLG